MYAVQALIGGYFKRFISYKEACSHADDRTKETGQPHEVVGLKLLYSISLSKLRISKSYNDQYKEKANAKV